MFGTRLHSGLRGPVFFCLVVLAGGTITPTAPRADPLAFKPRLTATAPPQSAAADLPRIPLQIGKQRLTAEVAADEASRSRGLMFREKLAPDHGMLFVFPQAAQYCFWMKNTLVPLTVAFIDATGKIINLADMQPLSRDSHCAMAPAQYALEMEQGWFARQGIRSGSQVQGLPRLVRHPRP